MYISSQPTNPTYMYSNSTYSPYHFNNNTAYNACSYTDQACICTSHTCYDQTYYYTNQSCYYMYIDHTSYYTLTSHTCYYTKHT